MKELLVGLALLASMSSFAEDTCADKLMPQDLESFNCFAAEAAPTDVGNESIVRDNLVNRCDLSKNFSVSEYQGRSLFLGQTTICCFQKY